MPISGYFGGHGASVMRSMKHRYGSEKGERVFYATANKKGMAEHINALKKKGKLKTKARPSY